MRLELDDDQKAVRDAIAGVLSDAIPDRVRSVWGSGFLEEEYRALGRLGMLTLAVSDGSNPDEGTAVEACVLGEELGRHSALSPVVTSVIGAAAMLGRTKSEFEPAPLLSGTTVWALAARERGRLSHQSPRSSLTRYGTEWRLTGEKVFVEWAPTAERLVVTCKFEGEWALAIVTPSASGVTVVRNQTNTGGQLGRVELADVVLGSNAVVAVGHAVREAFEFSYHRTLLFQSAYLLGAGLRSLELTVAHVKERRQFDRVIGSFQAVKQAVADTHVALSCARLMVYEEATRSPATSTLKSLAGTKAWVAEKVSDALRVAHELHGGHSVVDDHEVSLLYRRCLGESALYGSPSELWSLMGSGDQSRVTPPEI